MPRDKDLKRIIRKRMEKTGEAYTTARAHTLRDSASQPAAERVPPANPAGPTPASAGATPADYATLAGFSDDAVRAKTGRDWSGWVETLDAIGAAQLEHRDIARIVHEQHDVPGWWAQAVTVGYERIRGLRERGQRRDGGYEASRSRTFGVPVEVLFDAWADAARRQRWLSGAEPTLRTASRPRSLRLDWNDGSVVALWFTAKGDAKSTVSVQHMKLPDRETADRLKDYWGHQLDALAEQLRSDGA